MSLIHELASQPGVMAAGEYAYRGDRFSYEGQLSEELARMASIMCRTTSMALHMQVDMLKQLGRDCGCAPAQGWSVKGKDYTVCVRGNVFCFIDNSSNEFNNVMKYMDENIEKTTGELV